MNLSLSDEDMQKTGEVIKALRLHAQGQLNVVMERRNFNLRFQQEGEQFDDFLIDIKELVKTCAFCSKCQPSLIRDRIVVGIQDSDTIEHMLVEKDLPLQKAIDMCRAEEAAKRHCEELKADSASSTSASHNAISHYKQQKQGRKPNRWGQGRKWSCFKCTRSHGKNDVCPAAESTCAACHKQGHWAKSKNCNAGIDSPAQDSGFMKGGLDKAKHNASMGCMLAHISDKVAPRVNVTVGGKIANGTTVPAIPDSGAERTACGIDTLGKLGIDCDNLRLPSTQLRAADNHEVTQLGEFDAWIMCGDRSVQDTIHVVQGTQGLFLSWYVARDLGFLPANYPLQQPEEPTLAPVQVDQDPPPPDIDNDGAISRMTSDHVTADDLMNEFPRVFDGKIRAMPGEEFRIQLEDDAVPFCVKAPRAIPYAYRDKLRTELDNMVAKGIITPISEPTTWCAPIVVVPKKNSNDIRLCVDLSKLNKFVQRERYQSPTPREAVADIAATQANFFTTCDALAGYHQCPLAADSQPLTTFITPFGRFMFLRAPFGISSISEHYNRRMDEALGDIPQTRKIVDDCLAYDVNFDSHVTHVRKILQRCADKGISLKREKFVFAQKQVQFCGYILSPEGYRIDPCITEAITQFPKPTNITDLRSFFGLANQLGEFTDVIAAKLEPLRPLLKPKNAFCWDEVHDRAFTETKEALASAPILTYYDPNKPTSLHVDASRLNGIGFVLRQRQTAGTWSMVQAGSRFLTETESRYAMIEIELLGIVWATKKCRIFLDGLSHFEIVTDHRPLLTILNKYQLDEIENPRLQRLRMQLLNYKYTVTWQRGKDHLAADALSRSPVSDPHSDDEIAEQEVELHLRAIIASNHSEAQDDLRLNELRQVAELDDTYQELRRLIVNGFPQEKNKLSLSVRPYWPVRDRLAFDDGLIVCGCRLVIPKAMRKKTLESLHDSHQGISRTKRRARLVAYWPNIDADIERVVRSCQLCSAELPSQPKEPLKTHPEPSRVFEHMCTDLFTYGGRNFLIVTDVKSGWPTTFNLGRNISATHIIGALREVFQDTAVPTILYSDGGPQYTSRVCQQFLQEWGVKHVVSSPHYPQSNGCAEASVKGMKKLVKRCWDRRARTIDKDKWAKGLLQWRNTPRANGLSPAQVLFGHPARDILPVHKRAFAKEWQKSIKDVDTLAADIKQKLEKRYNSSARPLPPLQLGSKVAVQDHNTKKWNKYGIIVHVGDNRDYMVKLTSGRVWRRNRRFIRKRYPIVPPSPNEPIPGDDIAQEAPPPEPTPVPQTPVGWRSHRERKVPERLIEVT